MLAAFHKTQLFPMMNPLGRGSAARHPACVLSALIIACSLWLAPSTARATDYAHAVVSYAAGSNASPGYTNPSVALGPPERFTGEGISPAAITPFHPAFGSNEIVSIGAGGHLTLAFSPPIPNRAENPFGIDLIIFGNSFFTDAAYPSGTVGGIVSDGGTIELSPDGINWVALVGVAADGPFPTMGFTDIGPYSAIPGLVPTDHRKPVNPAWSPASLVGKSYAEIVSIYDGSAGGTGIDIASVGLSAVVALRISVPAGLHPNVEIDAISVVPAAEVPGDIDGSGTVDGADLAAVLSAFGSSNGDADIDGSGLVDGSDLAAVLAGWTSP